MKRGKQSYRERAERKLLELWEGGEGFGSPVGCIATTFTFDAAFFEEECLTRFAGVESDPSEHDRVYVIEREEKLSQCFAAVIVDQAHVPTHRSLRWHVLTARVPHGIQHAKLSLLVWETRIRVLIGSANLTVPGYRRNYENVAVLEFQPDPDESMPLDVLEQVLAFIEQLRQLAPGAATPEGPQAGVVRFLAGVRRQIAKWPRSGWGRGQPRAVLLPVRPGQPSLFAQLGELTNGKPYDAARVQSPFFDDGDGAKRVVTALEAILARRGDRTLHLAGPGCRLPDDTVQLGIPEVLREPFIRRLEHRFAFVDDRAFDDDGDPTGETRALHAKSLWLEREDAAIYCIGSSNFTCAGTGLAKVGGNYELNLAYVMPDLSSELVQICKQTYPPAETIDPDVDEVRFVVQADTRTAEGTELVGLPMAFGEATFVPGTAGVVRLEFNGDAPAEFIVASDDNAVLFDRARWEALGRPATVELAWSSPRPPSHLRVTWQSDGGEMVSIWTVNVVDLGLLPPPDELRALNLEELMSVLCSASPAHQTVPKLLARRKSTASTHPQELDPHRRIDTRSFLLQRMRRFATALEGLRDRLERPVYSREALRWRLAGPFGVTVLAQRLAAEDQEGAAFMISELARTVDAVRIPASGGLATKDIGLMIKDVIRELHEIAKQHPAPPTLAAYVNQSFEELVS